MTFATDSQPNGFKSNQDKKDERVIYERLPFSLLGLRGKLLLCLTSRVS